MGLLTLLQSLTSDERVERVLAARAEAVARAWAARRSDPEDKDALHHFIEPRFLVRKEAGNGPRSTAEEQFLDQSQLVQLDEKLAKQWREAFQPLGGTTDDGPTRLEKLLKLADRIVITEDAGAGKSIFTHWAIAWLSTADAWRRMHERGLPILAVRFERRDEKWPLSADDYRTELARHLVKHCQGYEQWPPHKAIPEVALEVVEQVLRDGRVVIFCDALDQIIGKDAANQLDAFWSFESQLHRSYPRVKVVVTSRSTAVQQHADSFKAPWKHVMVAGFSAVEQVRYLADLIPWTEPENVNLTEQRAVRILSHERLFGEFHAEVADLLQTPVILSIVRSIAKRDANHRGEFPHFSNRADLYFQATTRLLNRNLEKGVQLSSTAKVELREALSATAMAMMILEAGGYAVRGEPEMERLSKLAKSYVSPELKAKWTDVWEKMQQIADVSHRLILEEKSNDFFGWKHKGMMEFYAGLYLSKNDLPAWKQPEIRLEDHRENEHRLTDLLAKSHWNWVVRFAIELPQAENEAAQTFADIPTLRRTLTSLFAAPIKEIRPTELMYRAWALFQLKNEQRPNSAKKYLVDLQSEGAKILASFQQQFTQILTDPGNPQAYLAAQLVPFHRLEAMVVTGQLTSEQLNQLRNAQPQEYRQRLPLEKCFVKCPATDANGFLMETSGQEGEREHPHRVQLDSFWMAATQVTREQYRLFEPNHEAWSEKQQDELKNKGDRCPVINVSWYSALMFALYTGNKLPSEAQWEYACRAGLPGDYCHVVGEDGQPVEIKKETLDRVAYWKKGWGMGPQPVAMKDLRPNFWGMYDMHGNVWEWVFDWYAPKYYETEDAKQKNPPGPSAGSSRVLRGGSFVVYRADFLRCAYRFVNEPGRFYHFLGFRLCGLSLVSPQPS